MQTGMDGVDRNAQPRGDLLDWEVAVVAKGDDDAVLGGERRDRAGEQVAVMRLGVLVPGCRRNLDRDVPRPPARRSQTIATGVDQDPVEPLPEPSWITQGRPLPPCLLERVMRGVLRVIRVA